MSPFGFANALLFYLPLLVLCFFVFIALFQWLWNITIPQVFGLKSITFWEAFRLLLISGFLFSGSFIKYKSGG